MVMGNVPGYLVTLKIWRIQLTARSHLLWCKIIGGKFWQDCETSVVKFQDCKFYFFVPKSDEIFRCKFFFNLEGGHIDALNTQRNLTYLHQGAINKPQFQFLSLTACHE